MSCVTDHIPKLMRNYGSKRVASRSLGPAKKRAKPAKKKRKTRGKTTVDSAFSTNTNLTLLKANNLTKSQFGTEYSTKLIYYDNNFSLNPGIGGTAATWVFQANGLYDPDITGTGHQPAGFDELMSFFDHYTVKSSKITLQLHTVDSAYQQNVGVYINDDQTAEPDERVIIENGRGQYVRLNTSGTTSNCCTLEDTVSVSDFLGRPNVMDEDDLRGSVTANPQEGLYWHVWAAPLSGVDADGVGFDVRIEFWVTFTEPKLIGLS